MSTSPKYPTITDAHLVPFRALELQLKEHPGLLDMAACPYPPHIKSIVRRLLGDGTPAAPTVYSDDDLEREISDLYTELRRLGVEANSGDAKDKISVIKQSAELLGKLVGFRERIINVREMNKFMKTVMQLLETVISPAQRSDFIENMGKFLDV